MVAKECVLLLMQVINPNHRYELEVQQLKELKMPKGVIEQARIHRDKDLLKITRACEPWRKKHKVASR